MWKAFAEQLKQCGRNGTLFVLAIFALVPVLLSASAIAQALGRLATPVFVVVWLLVLGHGAWLFRRAWNHPARLGKLPPLSENELSVARSKLTSPRHRS